MPEKSRDTFVRKASLVECYHIVRHSLGLDSCVIVSAKYQAADCVLDRSTVYAALHRVITKHAALGVQVHIEAKGSPFFVRLDSVDLTKVVEFSDIGEDELKTLMVSHFARPFETGAAIALPLWRLVVLRDNTVVFVYHHGIADGQSGLAFHQALLSALNEVDQATPEPAEVVPVPPDSVLSPRVEKATDLSVSFAKFCQVLYSLYVPTSWTSAKSAWSGNDVGTDPSLHMNVHTWEISPAQTAALLQACRSHNTTLTALFHTLAVPVLSRLIAAQDPLAHKYRRISTAVAISLRRFTGTPADAMCDHVSTYHSYPPLDKDLPSASAASWTDGFSWETSAQFSSALQKATKKSRQEIGLLKYLFGRYSVYFEALLGTKRGVGFELSNLGRFPPNTDPTGGKWQIDSMCFGQCDAYSGAAMKLGTVGSPSGAVGICFTWGKDALDDVLAEKFISAFKDGIRTLAGEDVAKTPVSD